MSDWEEDWDQGVHAPTVQKVSYNDKMVVDDNWEEMPKGQPQDQSQSARSFQVEKRYVGIVIGRGGANIREIEGRFNVHMKIGKNC